MQEKMKQMLSGGLGGLKKGGAATPGLGGGLGGLKLGGAKKEGSPLPASKSPGLKMGGLLSNMKQ